MEKKTLRKSRARRKADVLKALESDFELEVACQRAGVARRTVFNWRLADPAFERAVQEARRPALERLKTTAYQRAMNGWDPLKRRQGKRLVDDKTASLYTFFVTKAFDPIYRDSYRPHPDAADMTITFTIPAPPGFLAKRQQQPALPGEVIEGEIIERDERSTPDASR